MGDGGAGKTASTIQFVANHFVEMYDPTIEDSYRRNLVVGDEHVLLEVLDTAGQDDFSPLRDSWIRESQAFLLVYSLTERKSLEYLDSVLQQIRRTKEDEATPVPIVLAGNKCDLVAQRQVSAEEARAWARERGIATVVEMSAKTRHNINETFTELVKQVAAQYLPKKSGGKKGGKSQACTVL
jgi:GTPase KRas protein